MRKKVLVPSLDVPREALLDMRGLDRSALGKLARLGP
jgi:hypothetical protein